MTSYTVLCRTITDSERSDWEYITTVQASGSDQAIRKAANDGLGVYVAIPTRSFRPVQVAVKQRDPIVTITPIK